MKRGLVFPLVLTALACGPQTEVTRLSSGDIDPASLLATSERAFFRSGTSGKTVAWSGGEVSEIADASSAWWGAQGSMAFFEQRENGAVVSTSVWSPRAGHRQTPIELTPYEIGPAAAWMISVMEVEPGRFDLFEMDATVTLEPRLLSSLCDPWVSQTQTRIVVARCDESTELRLSAWAPGAYAQRVEFSAGADTGSLSATPDAEWVFRHHPNGSLWVYSVVEGTATEVASGVIHWARSPNGSRVAVWNDRTLTVTEVPALTSSVLVADDSIGAVRFDPSLEVFAYVSATGADGAQDWKVVRAAAPETARVLTTGAPRGWGPVFSEDRSVIAYKGTLDTSTGDAPLYVEDVVTGQRELLAEGGVQTLHGGYGGDIYYSVNVDGEYVATWDQNDVTFDVFADLFIRSRVRTEELASHLNVGASAIRRVPDSSAILFVAQEGSNRAPGLYLVPPSE